MKKDSSFFFNRLYSFGIFLGGVLEVHGQLVMVVAFCFNCSSNRLAWAGIAQSV